MSYNQPQISLKTKPTYSAAVTGIGSAVASQSGYFPALSAISALSASNAMAPQVALPTSVQSFASVVRCEHEKVERKQVPEPAPESAPTASKSSHRGGRGGSTKSNELNAQEALETKIRDRIQLFEDRTFSCRSTSVSSDHTVAAAATDTNRNSGDSAGVLDLSRLDTDLTDISQVFPPLVRVLREKRAVLLGAKSVSFNNSRIPSFPALRFLVENILIEFFPNCSKLDLIETCLDPCWLPYLGELLSNKTEGHWNSSTFGIKLAGNDLGGADIAAFLQKLSPMESSTSRILDQLHLGGNPLGDNGVVQLVRACLPAEVRVGVKGGSPILCHQPNAVPLPISQTNSILSHLTALSLRQVQMTDAGLRHLCLGLQGNTSMTDLSLRNNDLGDAGMLALAQALRTMTSLTSLEIDSVGMTDASAPSLFNSLKHSRSPLRTLQVSANPFAVEGARELGHLLGSETARLTALDLSHCSLSDEASKCFLEGLQQAVPNGNCAVVTLKLSGNSLSSCAFIAPLCTALADPACPLLTLEADQCEMTGSSFEALCGALSTEGVHLKRLSVKKNFARREGAVALANMLARNTSLVNLHFNDNEIDRSKMTLIATALEEPGAAPRLRDITAGGQSCTPPMKNDLTDAIRKRIKDSISRRCRQGHPTPPGSVPSSRSVSPMPLTSRSNSPLPQPRSCSETVGCQTSKTDLHLDAPTLEDLYNRQSSSVVSTPSSKAAAQLQTPLAAATTTTPSRWASKSPVQILRRDDVRVPTGLPCQEGSPSSRSGSPTPTFAATFSAMSSPTHTPPLTPTRAPSSGYAPHKEVQPLSWSASESPMMLPQSVVDDKLRGHSPFAEEAPLQFPSGPLFDPVVMESWLEDLRLALNDYSFNPQPEKASEDWKDHLVKKWA